MPIPLLALGAGYLLLKKGKGLGIGKIKSAAKPTNALDAVLLGYGSKSIAKIAQNVAGGMIPAYSVNLPIVNLNIGVLDAIRYYIHNGGIKPNMKGLLATFLPLLYPNPTGSIGASTMLLGTGRGGGGANYKGLGG